MGERCATCHCDLVSRLGITQKIGADALLSRVLSILLGGPESGTSYTQAGCLSIKIVSVSGGRNGVQTGSMGHLLSELLKRDPNQYTEYAGTVQEIVDGVRAKGDEALFAYTRQFDRAQVDESNIRVTETEIQAAMKQVPKELLQVMTTNSVESWHSSIKEHAGGKRDIQKFSLCVIANHTLIIGQQWEQRDREAQMQWRHSKYGGDTRVPELARFPGPIQALLIDELREADKKIANGMPFIPSDDDLLTSYRR